MAGADQPDEHEGNIMLRSIALLVSLSAVWNASMLLLRSTVI